MGEVSRLSIFGNMGIEMGAERPMTKMGTEKDLGWKQERLRR